MKGGKKGADKGGEFNSPTVTDPKTLQSVCVGIQLEEGAPEVSLKPDDEYPNWLWEMSVEPKYLPEHFTPDTEDYYRALEKSNWSLKSDRLKMRSYEHENKYHLFNNFNSPLETQYVKNKPDSELAQKLMAVEEVYMNSKVTRKTSAEFEKGFNPELPYVRLNAASLPSTPETKLWYGKSDANVPKGDYTWTKEQGNLSGKKRGGNKLKRP
jgi:hypothetical protein